MIRILVVDDHAVVRAGIRALLAEVDDIEVVGEAADGREAIAQVTRLKPDVVLMDLVMPEVDGVQAISAISEATPEVRILALTSFSADDKLFPAIKAGASGYLLKDTDPRDLILAIRQTHRGECYLHPHVARKVLQELYRPDRHATSGESLTERETEVLAHVARGLTNQEIADSLFVSEATIRTHVSSILAKLHLTNRVQAALYAIKRGVAPL